MYTTFEDAWNEAEKLAHENNCVGAVYRIAQTEITLYQVFLFESQNTIEIDFPYMEDIGYRYADLVARTRSHAL